MSMGTYLLKIEENEKNKWMILDNLPTIWIVLVILFGMVLIINHGG